MTPDSGPAVTTEASPPVAASSVHFSSTDGAGTDDWWTPTSFYRVVAARYGPFVLDVCASEANHKCAFYFTADDDGLAQDWVVPGHDVTPCWCNPPYGRTIGAWMAKCATSSWSGRSRVVALVPARTDTAWWNEWAMRAEIVHLVEGRIKFVGHKKPTEANPDRVCPAPGSCPGCAEGAPFPSAVLVFGDKPARRPRVLPMDRAGRVGDLRLKCQVCGDYFRATRNTQRTCSGRCRTRLWRLK